MVVTIVAAALRPKSLQTRVVRPLIIFRNRDQRQITAIVTAARATDRRPTSFKATSPRPIPTSARYPVSAPRVWPSPRRSLPGRRFQRVYYRYCI